MLQFDGSKEFARPVAEVAARLSDLGFLVQCIPGVESVTGDAGGDTVACVLRPGFSFARGTLELTVHRAEHVPGQSVRLTLHSKGVGTTSAVETRLAFAPTAAGTRVDWQAEVKQLGGLLKAVPPGLLKAAAQKVIADAWVAVDQKLHALS